MGGVGEVFVVDWACLIRWALGRGEIRYWPSNCIGAGDIGTWGCEGFLGIWPCGCCGYGMGISLLFLCPTYSSPPISNTG